MNNEERDEQICALYKEGCTQAEIARRFEITESWVGQILRKAGLSKDDRPLPPRRPKFTGIRLSEVVKEQLRQEAKRDGLSMSKFISILVVKELRDRGIDCEIARYLREEDVPLPLEGAEDGITTDETILGPTDRPVEPAS